MYILLFPIELNLYIHFGTLKEKNYLTFLILSFIIHNVMVTVVFFRVLHELNETTPGKIPGTLAHNEC